MNAVVAAAKVLAQFEVPLLVVASTLVIVQGDLIQLGAAPFAVAKVVQAFSLAALILQKILEAQPAAPPTAPKA